jgi:hypothetical protein
MFSEHFAASYALKRVFHKKKPARELAIAQGEMNHFMYASDISTRSGAKKYIVTSFQSFLSDYLSLPPSQRTFYEVILKEFPCKLYFDLEFNSVDNPHLDMSNVMNAVHQNVQAVLKRPILFNQVVVLHSNSTTNNLAISFTRILCSVLRVT